uniref:Cytochrome P450 4c3 n=1 Tax=Elaeophora elaphi TaxID=1147741 RepID=A0A0R3S6H5_9BILA
MFVVQLLFLIVVLMLIKRYAKEIRQRIVEKRRFVQLINQLPGPTALEMLGEILRFGMDSKKFSSRMEAIFRKYAYQHDHGIICLWFGLKPILVLTRSTSAKVILENTKLMNKSDDYDIFKRLNMLENLDKHCDTNETFDLLPYLHRYGLDIIAETTMGIKIDSKHQHISDQYREALPIVQQLMWARLRYPWYWFAPIRWLTGFDKKLDYYCNICKKLTSQIITEKKKEWEAFDNQPSMDDLSASGKKQLTFMDLLFSFRQQYSLTDEEIRDQVDMFLAAGSDSVSIQIGFNLFALGHRQHYQEKVYEEIKRVLGETERDITPDEVSELKYLYQCICETGRLMPSAAIIGRKIDTELDLCGYTVPAGTTCCISPFSIMRDPKHYDNPEGYDPEHFSPEKVKNRDPFAFVPFSAGIRNCIGSKFANLALMVTLAHILRRYRVTSMISEVENQLVLDLALKPSKGIPVRLERR